MEMHGIEAILAALGGLLLGLGLGFAWAERKAEASVAQLRMRAAEIERRAMPLLRATQRSGKGPASSPAGERPLDVTSSLLDALEHSQHADDLAFSDTMEASSPVHLPEITARGRKPG